MNKKNILTFVIVFLLLNFILSYFSPSPGTDTLAQGDFGIQTVKKEWAENEIIDVKIKNNTQASVVIKNECPEEPLKVLLKKGGNWEQKTYSEKLDCSNTSDLIIEPGKEVQINYKNWNHKLFNTLGVYKIQAEIYNQDKTQLLNTLETNEFEIKPQGWFGYFWTTIFYQPIYNTLVWLTSIVPGQNLGYAIILLTILIRLILLVPSQKALKSQRKLQEIQPKLNHLKEKHKHDQETLAKETMALWKEHKVSPLGSCLPLLIQFPVLIALFYVIQSGLTPNNSYLLYDFLKNISLEHIDIMLFGILDLTKVNIFVLPILVGAAQFAQMQLTMSKRKNKDDNKAKKKEKTAASEMETANKMMVYVMPVMIAFFTASVPAGVGIYWITSTIFGIGQQLVVNKQVAEETAQVRVIEKN